MNNTLEISREDLLESIGAARPPKPPKRRKRHFPWRLVLLALGVLVVIAAIIFGIHSYTQNGGQSAADKLQATLQEAQTLANGYFYDEALTLLSDSKYAEKEAALALKQEIEAAKAALVPYDGQYYHVFFHSLIIYPELAFDGDYKHEGYDMWMTTVSEFKAMLPQLYERGFILYPLDQVKADGEILLPPGKKPLIVSIDDVNYYEYMKGDGFADRLVINDEGNLACEVTTPTGEVITTYDGDVMPILDEFVREHPDFSWRGAKGVVAVTGYEGVFGYRTVKLEGEAQEKAKSDALIISQKLLDTGWLLACHSYTHNDYFRDGGVEMEDLTYDTNRFKERIADLIFNTNIYISPFGYFLSEGDERLAYMKNMGYTVFCPVSPAMRTYETDEGVLFSERFNLDRYNMRAKKEYINETFFDVDSVYYQMP